MCKYYAMNEFYWFHFYILWSFFYRGEKLYVTKDKRLKTNWRKRILWTTGAALGAAVLTVAGLLASE